MRAAALFSLMLAGCSFMISVPDELPSDRAKLECARDGSCCPDTWFFPILDGVAAIATGLGGVALYETVCEDQHPCSIGNKLAYGAAPAAAALTLAVASIYGVHENGRCKEMEREARRKLDR